MRIINARIYTMAGQIYENGYLQEQAGKIVDVGPMECCPQNVDKELFDAKGGLLLPGLVDAHCHLGMWQDGLGFEGDDGNEDSDPCTPQLRGLDGIKLDTAFTEAARGGVTTVITGPGSANPIAGQMCALKTDGRRVDSMLLKAPLAIKMAMGENPKTTYREKNQGPVTRMGIAAIIREQLAKAQKYDELLRQAAEDDEVDEPDYDAKCEALLPLLHGEIKAHFHAHAVDDIFTAIRIAKEFSLQYVIVHGTEGYLAAEELAKEKTCIIAGPLLGARLKPELARMSDEMPHVLQEAGVTVAICTDHPEVPIQYLMLSAKLAVEHGMEPMAALRAITSDAARICGLEGRVGSLQAGLDADCALYAQDPMTSNCSQPVHVWINGKSLS